MKIKKVVTNLILCDGGGRTNLNAPLQYQCLSPIRLKKLIVFR